MSRYKIIKNFFQFKVGDIIQYFDNSSDGENCWVDLEYIMDKNAVAILFATKRNYFLGCETRVIRRY